MAQADKPFVARLQEWAAGYDEGDEGDPIVSAAEIRDFLEAQFESIGTFVDDVSDLPPDASPRSQTFLSPADLLKHWLPSGLVFFDGDGNLVPNPMLNIVRRYDVDTDDYEYEVHISNGSP